MANLTERQERFVQEYLKNPNATEAAINAGYSKKTARSIGQENLTKPDIMSRISAANEERQERTQVTADMVIKELAKGAFAELDTSEMKFADKLKCLELLSKHLGLLDGSGAGSKDKADVRKGLLEVIGRIGVGGRKGSVE